MAELANVAALEERFEALAPDRIVRWFRVRELTPPHGPFGRTWIFAKLKQGALRGRRVDGVLLISGQSVEELIRSAPDWAAK